LSVSINGGKWHTLKLRHGKQNVPRLKKNNLTINKKNKRTENPIKSDFDLWVLLEQTRFAICRAKELELAKINLTVIQASVLYTLRVKGGEATQKEIADFTMRQHHSVSTLVNRMIRSGLLKKVKYSGDKGTRIAMTEKGQELYDGISDIAIAMVFSSLSKEEKVRLAESLKVLRSKARSMLGMDHVMPFLSSE
jgi:DNA-binding MarR family transcriptional regulator